MSEPFYPPAGFYFSVTVLGSLSAAALVTSVDASFQEISGIEAEFGTEEVTEGGENRFVHKLPTAAKYPNLVLKRGVVSTLSTLGEWVSASIGSTLALPILPQNLQVSLLDEEGTPSVAWLFVNAYPVRSEVGALDSTRNEVLIETLELSYNYFQRFNLGVL